MSVESQLISQDKEQKISSTLSSDRNMRVFNLSTKQILIGIIAIAVLLRVASGIYQGNEVDALPGVYDQLSYDALAKQVIQGNGFRFDTPSWPATRAGEPTAHWSYLYTFYLSLIYTLFGASPLIARIIQAIMVGLLHSWLTWRLGHRIFGETIGLVAAGLSAVYIYFFFYAGSLMTEPFYIIGVLWVIDIALRIVEARQRESDRVENQDIENQGGAIRWSLYLELGLAIGITALFRQAYLLFTPFLFLWIWWVETGLYKTGLYKTKSIKGLLTSGPQKGDTNSIFSKSFFLNQWKILSGFLLVIAVTIALIVPATIRNYRAFDTFVLLNTNAGYAFFWGNHPIYGTQFVGILPSDGPSYYDLIPKELLHLNEAELDKALLKQGLGFVTDDPIRYIILSASRTLEYFKFWPSSSSSSTSNFARMASFGLFLPFMIYGLWISIRSFRRMTNPIQQPALLLLGLFIFIYTGMHLLTWALIRYRLPVDALLLLFAAAGIVDLFKRFNKDRDLSQS